VCQVSECAGAGAGTWEEKGRTDLFRFQKVTRVRKEHLLNSGVEDDGGHWALVARVCPAPAPVRVGEIDLYAVHGLGLVFLLCLQDELLQNGVIPCDYAVYRTTRQQVRELKEGRAPDLIDRTSQLLPSVLRERFMRSQWPL
jgi:hypothetical protein